MIQCKNCGKIVEWPSLSCNVSDRIKQYKFENEKVPEILSDTYKDFHKVYICEDCRYPFDYKDFSMRNFFSWLMYSSDADDSKSASAKAVTRYFGLDGKTIQSRLQFSNIFKQTASIQNGEKLMTCKHCGKEITWDLITYRIEPGQEIPVSVPAIYNGYTNILICGKCNMVIDYKDLPVERFLEWLNDCTGKKEDTGNLKGKALIRYFGLDKLLETKKKAGD